MSEKEPILQPIERVAFYDALMEQMGELAGEIGEVGQLRQGLRQYQEGLEQEMGKLQEMVGVLRDAEDMDQRIFYYQYESGELDFKVVEKPPAGLPFTKRKGEQRNT